MKRIILYSFLCAVSFACKETNNDNKAPELSKNNLPPPTRSTTTPTSPTIPSSTGIVEAKLSGYPADQSAEASYSIQVTGPKEYKWKYGEREIDCASSGGYTSFQSSSTPIKIDLSESNKATMVVKVCVVGRSDSEEQKYATEATWTWNPVRPTLADQMEIVDGDNQIKVLPKTVTGSWLVIKSRAPLTSEPSPGKLYTVNESLGGGTVIGSGTASEITDNAVKNTETWYYTFFAQSPSRRYSLPLSKRVVLADQILSWYPRDEIKAGYVGVAPRGAADNRFVCQARHIAAGVNKGIHPGRTMNNDFSTNGRCLYEYGGTIFAARDFSVLMVNKGDPMNKVRWVSTSGSGNNVTPQSTFIPAGSIKGGVDEDGAVNRGELVICRGYFVNSTQIASFGKVSSTLGGCLQASITNTPTAVISPTLDVLTLK